MNNYKWCGCCEGSLPLDAFAKNKSKKDGLQERCRSCRSIHHQKVKHKRLKQTKEQKRRYLITSYGLNVEQFEQMLKDQNSKCAICKTDEWGKESPSIDHCHKSGKVRGLLCNNCNRALGLFKDNEGIVKNAASYLERSS
jgi:histone acetyltransferase (RNA polymerase elongator complex component)